MKRTFSITLLIIYCFLFGEVYIRIVEFSKLTNIQAIDAGEIERQKMQIRVSKDADINILVIGDSVLAGYDMAFEHRFLNVFEKELQKQIPNEKIEVIDTLVAGYNIYKKWEMFMSFIRNNPKPQVVILSYKFGDVYGEFPSKAKVVLSKEAKISGLRKLLYHSELLKFLLPRLNTLLKKGGVVLCFTEFYHLQNKAYLDGYIGWQKAQMYILDINRVCRDKDIDFMILLTPDFSLLPQNLLEKNTAVLSDFCKENKIRLVDLFEWFKDFEPNELALSRFDEHPNYKAQKILADKMADIIEDSIVYQ